MDPEQIALVQASLVHIQPITDTIAALFYQRLHQLDPSARCLFQDGSPHAEQSFMRLLWWIIQELHQPDRVLAHAQALGRQHAHNGVQSRHYVVAGVALLWALRQSLQQQFTPEIEAAWAHTFALLAETMAEAAGNERLHPSLEE
jgi:hemoglobin-like flavoprotein